MNYYILDETFNPPYDTYLVSELIDYPLIRKSIENDKEIYSLDSPKKFYCRGNQFKDFYQSSVYIIVSQKFLDTLLILNTSNQIHYYPICLKHQKTKKTHKDYYLLGIKQVYFFDYDRSDYEGIKEEKLIVGINKMVIDESQLNNQFMVRFKEFGITIVINEEAKHLLEAANIKGLKYIHSDNFIFPEIIW